MMPSNPTFINPNKLNGLSHPYYLDATIFVLGASGVIFYFDLISR